MTSVKTIFYQYIKYGVVGFLGYLLNIGTFSFFVYILGVWYIISSVIAFFITVSHNFVLHNFFSFSSKMPISSKTTIVRYLFFIVSSSAVGLFAILVLYFCVEYLYIHKVVSQTISSFIGGTINFFVSRKFIFRKK